MRWIVLLMLGWGPLCWATPDTSMTVAPSCSSGTTILCADETSRNNSISTTYNNHSHTDISQTATPLNIGAASGRTSISDTGMTFEGLTNDNFEATIGITDPLADTTLTVDMTNLSSTRTVTIPNANSVTLPTGAAFLLLSGACPAGTTDVSATYAGMLKIGTTVTTSVAAGATELPAHTHIQDAHTHTQNAHGHTMVLDAAPADKTTTHMQGAGGAAVLTGGGNWVSDATATNQTTTATNQSSGSATFATVKMCQVN